MRRETWLQIGGVLLLLFAGGLIWQWQHSITPEFTNAQDFRAWFWNLRSVDLVVQVGLLFVGALGITALLPDSDEQAAL